jgi:hypothetical protein
MSRALAALALLFLAAHVVLLPGTLGDIDSINFALGVREFDVARHQPHPPGYPIFIALAKLSTAAFEAAGVSGAEARGLAFWGAVGGAVLVPLLYFLFRALDGSARRAAWATLLTTTAPLLWFTALRPLSDVSGLAAAVAAQMLLLRAAADAKTVSLAAAAFAAGLAIGVRSQTFLLTLPLLGYVLLLPQSRSLVKWTGAIVAAAAGVLAWGIPLVVVSGGVSAYMDALARQGGEDFSGVVMFWNVTTLRVGFWALHSTFMAPWASVWLAVVVTSAGAIGIWTLRRERQTAALAAVIVLPYLIFHLVFHETRSVRYSLPLVPMTAWLAVRGLERISTAAVAPAAAAIAVWSLALALPATFAYARVPAPIFRAMDDLAAADRQRPVTVASHRRVFAESRRARDWLAGTSGTWLPSPPGVEWLELTRAWSSGQADAAWFLANPRRTDLALIDTSEAHVRRYRWAFDASVFAGGARPDEFDGYSFPGPPGWFLEEGWALTPEVAGITFRQGAGPHQRGSTGWIRRRDEAAEMVLGGRHLGPAGASSVVLTATIDHRTVLDREVAPGFFNERVSLPAGSLAGEGRFAHLRVHARALDGSRQPVSLEHFDVQSTGVPMFAFGAGWYEPDQERGSARRWRWMSDRAVLWVRPLGRDVRLTIAAESPKRYFDRPPALRVGAARTVFAQISPSDDFTWEVVVPRERLSDTGGEIWIESDRTFVPGQGKPGGDQRALALRVFSVTVN